MFGLQNAPNYSTIKRLIEKFERIGSVMDKKLSVRSQSGWSIKNIALVTASVGHRSLQLAVSTSNL